MREPAAPEGLRVAIVTNVLPHYRREFFRRVFQIDGMSVRVFCQTSIRGVALDLIHEDFPDHVTLVAALGLSRERLVWQRLPWRKLLTSFDVLFVSGNPRVVSNVVLAGLARLLGRPVVLWGQAHTAGAGKTTEKLRLGWWRGFDHLFVYTEGETRWLKARGFERQHVLGMNNGLDQERIDAAAAAWRSRGLESWRREQGVAERTQVLSCARLEPKNRFDLWLEAMPGVIAKVPDLLWCVVGEGVERPTLEAKTRQLGLENHVRWLGRIVDEDQLAPWFLTSRLLVHPGAIGLTLLHAFGYGLPVVTHDDPGTQMPEYDAFAAGENGLAYRSGDRAALAEAVLQGLGDELARQRMGREAHEVARERYNVRIMTERFEAMARQTAASTIERPARSEAS